MSFTSLFNKTLCEYLSNRQVHCNMQISEKVLVNLMRNIDTIYIMKTPKKKRIKNEFEQV